MSNVMNLFENLMTYNDSKKVQENDETLLNLTIELPGEIEDLDPSDVNVNVGVMNVNTDEPEGIKFDDSEEDETDVDADLEDTEEDATAGNDESTEDDQDAGKEESLSFKKESSDVETAKSNIKKRVLANENKDCETGDCDANKREILRKKYEEYKNNKSVNEGIFDKFGSKNIDLDKTKANKVSASSLKPGDYIRNDFSTSASSKVKAFKIVSKNPIKGKNNEYSYKLIDSTGKNYTEEISDELKVYKYEIPNGKTPRGFSESINLNDRSINKLITKFVRENYKNVNKVVINKALYENKKLILKGYVEDLSGNKETIILQNRGFDPTKLENKRFMMDFKDISNTFGVIKESIKHPFMFTCSLKEGVLSFEEFKYSYKTMVESKTIEVTGKCALNESVEIKNENADQVKKFNEIVEKIKAAKSANDLIACKDEMDKSNIGDTLLSAAQMVWDDVNSRMKG